MGSKTRDRVSWGIMLGSAATALFLFGGIVRAESPAIVINEIMWDETEYVELKNTTEAAVSLSGWLLARQRPGEERKNIVVFESGDVLTAGSYWLLEKNEAATTVPADKIVTSLTLLNSGEQLLLLDGSGAAVDTANPVGGWVAGENTSVGVAMERNMPAGDGTLAESWHTATGNGGGRGGTPRAGNTEVPVNTAPVAEAETAGTTLVGTSISFSAEDSTDGEGDELTYSWDFGDGGAGTGEEVSHMYTTAGNYTVTLTASDGKLTDSDELTVAVMAPVYSNALIINEFMPDPAGSDTTGEFIELFNSGGETVDVAGWKLDDAESGSAPYVIPAGTTIGGGAYRSFSRNETKVALNNEGDMVRLLAPDGNVKATASFGAANEGQSFNRVDGDYKASTTPTPGQPNVITVAGEDEEGKSSATMSPASATGRPVGRVAGAAVKKVSLSEVREEEKDSWVSVEGVVSAPPGTLGEQLIYLAGSGIQVYWAKGDWPKLELGSRVKLTAQVGTAYGETRLKLAAAKDLAVVRTEAPPEPHVVETGEIDEDKEGWLVTVAGEVVETDGDTFYVDDGSGEVKIFIKETTGIDKPPMKKGTKVTITGIVSRTTSGYRVLPRFQTDVRLGLVAGLTRWPATGFGPVSWGTLMELWIRMNMWWCWEGEMAPPGC